MNTLFGALFSTEANIRYIPTVDMIVICDLLQVIFSSLYQQVVPFTRDYGEIRSALGKLEEYNKTCIDVALAGVDQLLLDEWACSSQGQVAYFMSPFSSLYQGLGEGQVSGVR